ncbi:hypothetical protein ACTFIW_008506 [Dictyostelium discoideum]
MISKWSLLKVILVLLFIRVEISLVSSLENSISSSSAPPPPPARFIDDNIYVKNWGFEFGDYEWTGDTDSVIEYDGVRSYHLLALAKFGFNIDGEQIIEQFVFIPKINNTEQLKFQFSILFPIINSSPSSSSSSSSSSSNLSNLSIESIQFIIQLDNITLFKYNSENDLIFTNTIDYYQTISMDLDNELFGDSNYHLLKITSNKIKSLNENDYENENGNENPLSISIDNILIYKLPIQTISSDLYVSINGNDEIGNGTIQSPFRTIQKAIDSMNNTDPNQDYTIYIIGTTYEFQQGETVFNRGKRINLKSFQSSDYDDDDNDDDDGNVLIEISEDYFGLLFVSTSVIYQLNSSITMINESNIQWIVNDYQQLFDQALLFNFQSIEFSIYNLTFKDLNDGNDQQINETFSACQYSNLAIYGLTFSNVLNPPFYGFFIGNRGSTMSLYDFNLEYFGQFGINNFISMFYNNFKIETAELFCFQAMFIFQESNVTINNLYVNGFCPFIVDLGDNQLFSIENSVFTNITLDDNYLIAITTSPQLLLGGVQSTVINLKNINVFDCQTLRFLLSDISGFLEIDGLQMDGIFSLTELFRISNPFQMKNSNIGGIYLPRQSLSPLNIPIAKFYFLQGTFENVIFSEISSDIIKSFLYFDGCMIEFYNCSFLDSDDVSFISSTQSEIFIDTFVFSGLQNGIVFYEGNGTKLFLNNITMKNSQIGLAPDSSYDIVLNNSKIFNNAALDMQKYSISMFTCLNEIVIENTLFHNNEAFTLISTLNNNLTLVNNKFHSNVYGPLIVASQGVFYADQLEIVGSYSTNTYSNAISLYAMDSISFTNSKFIGVSCPLSVTFSVDTYFDNLNFINSTGDTIVINLFYVLGAWRNSYIESLSTSLLAPSFNYQYSGIEFSNVSFISISSSNYPFGIYTGSIVGFYHCNFSQSMSVVSGGMLMHQMSDVSFENCNFNSNSLKDAILVSQFSNIQMNDCNFIDNNAMLTSTVSAIESNLTFTNTLFSENTLSITINITNSNVDFNNCTFLDNDSPSSIILSNISSITFNSSKMQNSNSKSYSTFSLIQDTESDLVFQNSTFSSLLLFNTPIFFLNGTKLSSFNSTFSNNTNLNGCGGVFFFYRCDILLISNEFQFNSAHLGGAIYSIYSKLDILYSTFSNLLSTSGSAIFNYKSNVTLSVTIFKENQAKRGPYTDIQDTSSIFFSGGSIFISKDYFNTNNNNNNGDGDGDGDNDDFILPIYEKMYLYSRFNIEYCQFISNSAIKNGGAIFNNDQYSNINITISQFYYNQAFLSGGGAIYTLYPITDNSVYFYSNVAPYGNYIASNISRLNISLAPNNFGIQASTPFLIYISAIDIFGNTIYSENPLIYYISLEINVYNGSGSGGGYLMNTTLMSNAYTGYINSFEIENSKSFNVGSIFSFKASLTSDQQLKNVITTTIWNSMVVGCFQDQYIDGDGICQICPPGTSGYNSIDCFTCVDQLYCPGGDVVEWVTGYWFDNSTTIDIGPPIIYSCDPTLCIDYMCRENHQGILCGQCLPGYSKVMNYCVLCFEALTFFNPFIVFLFIVFVLMVTILLLFYEMPNRSILYSTFTNIQLISMLAQKSSNYTFFQIFNFRIDYISNICVSNNLNFLEKSFIGYGSMFFILLVSNILKSINFKFIQKIKSKINSTTTTTTTTITPIKLKPTFLNNFISSSILFFIPSCLFAIQTLNCVFINGIYYLYNDTEVTCFDSFEHIIGMVISCLVLAYYLIVIIYYLIILIKNNSFIWIFQLILQRVFKRRNINNYVNNNNSINQSDFSQLNYFGSNSTTKKTTTTTTKNNVKFKKLKKSKKETKLEIIYFSHFIKRYQFFQQLQIILNFLFVASSTFLIQSSSKSELIILSFLSIFFYIQVLLQPFKSKERNSIEILFSFILLFASLVNNSRFFSTFHIGYTLLALSVSSGDSPLTIKRLNAFIDSEYQDFFQINSVISFNQTIVQSNQINYIFSLDNSDLIINDNKFNSWKLNKESNELLKIINLEIENQYDIDLPLEFIGNFENVYITNNTVFSSSCFIYAGVEIPYTLDYSNNDTSTYKIFQFKTKTTPLSLKLKFKPSSLFPSSSSSSSSSPSSITIKDKSNLETLNNLLDNNYIVFEIDKNQNLLSKFFLPKIHIGEGLNKIGITRKYVKDYLLTTCNNTYVPITTVGNSNNVYDQFYLFRNNTINNILSTGCDINSMDIYSPDSSIILSCDIMNTKFTNITSNISMLFKLSSFPIINSTAIPILSGGIVPLSTNYDKSFSTLYIDILNKGNDNALFKIVLQYCRNDGNFNFNISGDQLVIDRNEKSMIVNNDNYPTRITFSLKSRSNSISTIGFCKFSIYQNDQYYSDFITNFSTTIQEFTPNPNNIAGREVRINNNNNNNNNLENKIVSTTTNCLAPKILKTINGVEYCVNECTIDQLFNSDTLECTPTTCYIKYISNVPQKIYYNSNNGLCESTPSCPNGYIYESNTCVAPKPIINDSNSNSNSFSDSSSSFVFPSFSDSSYFNELPDAPSGPSTALIIIIFVVASVLLFIVLFFIIRKCCSRKSKERVKKDKIKEYYSNRPIKQLDQQPQQQFQQFQQPQPQPLIQQPQPQQQHQRQRPIQQQIVQTNQVIQRRPQQNRQLSPQQMQQRRQQQLQYQQRQQLQLQQNHGIQRGLPQQYGQLSPQQMQQMQQRRQQHQQQQYLQQQQQQHQQQQQLQYQQKQ